MRHASIAIFLLSALCSCRPKPTPTAATSDSAASAEAPDAAAAGDPRDTAKPPPGANPELAEIAFDICAAAYRIDDAGAPSTVVGCRRPPPFEGPRRAPDGRFAHVDGDAYDVCAFSITHRGAFTRPGAAEVMLSFDNCRDDDSSSGWNGSMAGSAVVVERASGKWRVVAYQKNVNTTGCSPIRTQDGREVLVCESTYAAFQIGGVSYAFLLDFARAPDGAHTFSWLYEEVDPFDCRERQRGEAYAPNGLSSISSSLALRDVDGDGVADVVLDVDRAHAAPSAALEKKLRDACKAQANVATVLPRPTHSVLEFFVRKDAVVPSPATRKLLDAWTGESPDTVQLKDAAPPPFPGE